jgi:hypothetical protein
VLRRLFHLVGFYINGSLRNLITTGEGQPNGRGRPRVPAEEMVTGRGLGEARFRTGAILTRI